MDLPRNVAALDRRDRRLCVVAACWLILIRVSLSVQPFAATRRLCARAAARRSRGGAVGRIPWAVETVGAAVPGVTCLVRALAAEVMLRRAGELPELRIGVDPTAEDFEAHAWLEWHGRPVVGAGGTEAIVALPPLDRDGA